MKQHVPNKERGFILVAVIIAITLVAAIAFALSQQGASETNVTSGELERDQLRYVAEAGMAHAKLQLAKNTSCSGYTDIPETDFGADSYKAKFKTDEGSPVMVKATGYLASGAEFKLRSNPVRAYQPSTAVILQLGKTAGKDTMINRWFDIQNYGAVDNLTVRSDPSRTQRALLEFDLSAIPAGAKIISATLKLQQRAISTAGVINVHRVTRSWLEGTGTGTGGADGATWLSHDGSTSWSQPGGDFDSTLYAATPTTISKNGQWVAWDIRDLVDEWVSGQLPNDGLLLAGDGVVDSVEFHSSEGLDPASAPKLTIVFACECGKTCGGAAPGKNVLLVVGDAGSPSSGDLDRKALIESWGHAVTLIDDGDSQANFNTALAANDVVYNAGSGSSANVGTKLTAATIGVLSEDMGLVDELGIAEPLFVKKNSQHINVIDNTHYVTSGFSLGTLQLYSYLPEIWTLSGALAPGLQLLGETQDGVSTFPPGLAVLETGAELYGGGYATGRRVQVPWAQGSFDINGLNGNGRTIMQRAIEWGAGAGPAPPAPGYLDQFNDSTCDAAIDYAGTDGTVDWSPWAWTEINELDGPCSGQIRVATDPDIDDAGSSRLRVVSQGVRVYRTVDLTGFSQPTLSFDYRLIDYPALDFMRIRVFDGVVYTEIDRFTGPFDQTEYQSASYSLSAFAGLEIQVQFEFNGVSTTRTSYIDNVHIQEAGGSSYYLDEFNSLTCDPAADYAGSDGSRDWSSWQWQETLDDADPCSGNIEILVDGGSNRLKLKGDGTGIERRVDLSAFSVATLSFDYLQDGPFDAARYLSAWASADAGSNWTEVGRIDFEGDGTYQSASFDISAYVGPDAMVRFETADLQATRAIYIDNIHISDVPPGGGGSGGEVTFEEFTDASLSSAGLSITIPKPPGTAAGDLLIATIVTDGENKPEMTAPAGWTLIDHDKTSKQVTMDVLWKIAGASESGSYDFSWAKSQQAYGWIMRFTGHDPAAPIHDAQSDGGTSSSPVSPAVTTTIANTMIVRIGGFDDDDITPGDPGLSGHTAITMGASGTGDGTASGGAGYVLQSGTGDSGEASFSLTASEEYRAVTIAISPAP